MLVRVTVTILYCYPLTLPHLLYHLPLPFSLTPISTCVILCYRADPYEDQFEKRDKKKKEDIAKNEYQRLRNIGKSLKGGRVKGGH